MVLLGLPAVSVYSFFAVVSKTHRFGFLFYHFSRRENPSNSEFFFLPERELPDFSYVSTDLELSFDLPSFRPYRIVMDREGLWVDKVCAIIAENPQPRSMEPRPMRQAEMINTQRSHKSNGHQSKASETALRFYDLVMTLCAERYTFCHEVWDVRSLVFARMTGPLFSLGRDHPMADFGYCDYTWTATEREQFLQAGVPPRTVSDLPALTPVVPILLYARALECTFRGPDLSSAYFHRLNACRENRLVILDLFGPDTPSTTLLLTAIPSDDICPTKRQRDHHAENLTRNKKSAFKTRTPFISFMLKSGRSAGEYAIGNRGPLAYDDVDYAHVWSILQDFVGRQPFHHPPGVLRDPTLYQTPLC